MHAIISSFISLSSIILLSKHIAAAASAPPPAINPWLLMMKDTETVFNMLRSFPDDFANSISVHEAPPSSSAAASAAAAAMAISHGLVSLKKRNSNLCTLAYGGYNGASSTPNIITHILHLSHDYHFRHSSRLLQRRPALFAAGTLSRATRRHSTSNTQRHPHVLCSARACFPSVSPRGMRRTGILQMRRIADRWRHAPLHSAIFACCDVSDQVIT